MRLLAWRTRTLVVIAAFASLFLLYQVRGPFQLKDEEHVNAPYGGPRVALIPEGHHGFLPLQDAIKFCQHRRWDAYSTRDERRKVYDMFLINTELDWAEIRFNELKDEVDYFVVLESAQSFQEVSKPLYFKDYLAQFQSFKPKIIHQVIDFTNAGIKKGDTWGYEHLSRNALLDQILTSLTGEQAPNLGDVLVIGDVDEVPRASTLKALRNCAFPQRVTLMSHFYYYSFQWLNRKPQWPHPQATFYAGPVDTIKPEDLRNNNRKAYFQLYNAAWHYSSCFSTMAGLINKIESFSHKAYNHPYILNSTKLVHEVRRGEDIFERKQYEGKEEAFDRVDDNRDIPSYLMDQNIRQKFAYMLDRDPPNANFQDL